MIRFNKGEDNMERKENLPFATEMLKTQKFVIKSLIVPLVIVILSWLTTCLVFVWYLNQYDFTNSSESTVELTNQDNDNGDINVDGDIINGKN